jgi:pimeloyl-ACP methyl ester carboxylesterase
MRSGCCRRPRAGSARVDQSASSATRWVVRPRCASARRRVGSAAVAPFAELREVVRRETLRRWHGVLRPLTPLVRLCVRVRAGFDLSAIETVSACRDAPCPLLLVRGAHDELIPASHSGRLATAPHHGRVQRRVIAEAAHGNIFVKGGNPLYADVAAFFASARSAGSQAGW